MTVQNGKLAGIKPLLNLRTFVVVVILFNTFIPILGAREDEWDGSIIDYGVSTGDLRGIRHWFYSAGVEFQYFSYYFNLNLYHFSILSLGF